MGRYDDDYDDLEEADAVRPRSRGIRRRSRRDDDHDDYIEKEASNKIAAGLCGIFLGTFGVHKFILGMSTPGVIMLLVSLLTCGVGALVMHGIGLVEGIIYLTKTDEEFVRIYVEGQKEWF